MNFDDLLFTQNQKEAAIYALYQIARSDEDLAEEEISFIKDVGLKLGEVFDYMSVSSLIVKNSSQHITELKNFSEKQKGWFIVAVYTLINSDSRLFDEEFCMANGFFNAMGISKEDAVNLVSHSKSGLKFY